MEVENLEKKNKTLKILLIIVIIIALVVCGYLVYDKLLSKENSVNENNKNNDHLPIIPVIEEEEVFDRINTIIEKELYVLNGLKSIDEITSKIKAFLAIDLYCGETFLSECKNGDVKTLKASDLESTYLNSSLSNFEFENRSIPCVLYAENPDHFAWTYNSENETYTLTEVGHGILEMKIVDKELVQKKKENNLYIISYKYLWTTYGDFPDPLKLFASYEDASNMNNSIAEIEQTANKDNLIETYAKETSVYNSLDTYIYYFIILFYKCKMCWSLNFY